MHTLFISYFLFQKTPFRHFQVSLSLWAGKFALNLKTENCRAICNQNSQHQSTELTPHILHYLKLAYWLVLYVACLQAYLSLRGKRGEEARRTKLAGVVTCWYKDGSKTVGKLFSHPISCRVKEN